MSNSPVWHPFTQHGLGEDIPLVDAWPKALSLHTGDGRRVIDAISSWWVTTHGHNHPRIMAAVREQTEKLDQVIFAGWTHEPAETLARGLVEMHARRPRLTCSIPIPAPPRRGRAEDGAGISGTIAGEPRHRILVMEHSYHGDTIGAMSVGERGVFNRAYAPLLFDVDTIPFPQPMIRSRPSMRWRQPARQETSPPSSSNPCCWARAAC